MRDKTPFLLRVISLAVSVVLAVVCIVLALVNTDSPAIVFVCVFGMIVFICLVIPFFWIASLYERISEAEKQLSKLRASNDSFTSTSVISENDVARISMAAEASVKGKKKEKKNDLSASEEITVSEVIADGKDRERFEREKSIPKFHGKETAVNASDVFNRSVEEKMRAENEERGRKLFSETALDFPSVPVQKPEPAAFVPETWVEASAPITFAFTMPPLLWMTPSAEPPEFTDIPPPERTSVPEALPPLYTYCQPLL